MTLFSFIFYPNYYYFLFFYQFVFVVVSISVCYCFCRCICLFFFFLFFFFLSFRLLFPIVSSFGSSFLYLNLILFLHLQTGSGSPHLYTYLDGHHILGSLSYLVRLYLYLPGPLSHSSGVSLRQDSCTKLLSNLT